MNYEGKSVLSGGGGSVDPQVEKNKQAIAQLGQTFFLGAFANNLDPPATAQMWISGIPGRFYPVGYSPRPKDFLLHTYASSEFSALSDFGNSPYGAGWTRPESLLDNSAVFDITIRASFFSLPDIQIYVGLNITRMKDGIAIPDAQQYKVRPFAPSPTSIVYQYTLNIVVQVDLVGCDALEFYAWGGLRIPPDPPTFTPVTLVSGTTDENQIKVTRLR